MENWFMILMKVLVWAEEARAGRGVERTTERLDIVYLAPHYVYDSLETQNLRVEKERGCI